MTAARSAEPVAPAFGYGDDRAVPGGPLRTLLLDGRRAASVTHVESVPARPGVQGDWPEWVPGLLRGRLAAVGVDRPWLHQVAAADAARAGRHVVLSTGTASGKSLGYLLPLLSGLLEEPGSRALYLAPTKALARDQLAAVRRLSLTEVRAAAIDGDTPREDRDWARAHATYVHTNPDMLSYAMLPQHARWASWFRGLRYVVVDECHHYRGVFGSHVAQVLRRLRRICRKYGSDPVFLLASATVADPGSTARRLTGLPVDVVDVDASSRGALTFALYEPPLQTRGGAPSGDAGGTGDGAPGEDAPTGENGAPVRRSATAESAELLADLVADGTRTLAFVRSRRAAEGVALSARRMLTEAGLPGSTVAAYRAGYLPEERRQLERALRSGDLVGLAATNALELGIDISGLDAVLLAGFPGTLASLWQQAGRAGRRGGDALAVLVARDDPLDTYLVHHPEAVFGRPVEAAVLDPDNPYILTPHLECAAAELPLTEADLAVFGPAARPVLDDLVRRGRLRKRPAGWYWTSRERPSADLRGTGGAPISVVESATGRLLGTVDRGSAHGTVHDGAIYLHQGESYLVQQLCWEDGCALVEPVTVDWTTSVRDITDIRIIEVLRSTKLPAPPGSAPGARPGEVTVHFGTVDVSSQVVSYLRRRVASGEVLGEEPLDLPARELRTRAVWYTVAPSLLERAGIDAADVPGAVHAAEHAAIGLLPLWATCDRWDIGGVSTALHADTEATTVFVYDGAPGGAGFAERGYERLGGWLGATRDAIASCECPAGCPSCVQSPKCGNGNDPLDKAAALRLLEQIVGKPAAARRAA
ncbi:MAG: box helicase protein [Frankiaceae bacterium]|nr:box helicase protein [Frankiaceae bacterium]